MSCPPTDGRHGAVHLGLESLSENSMGARLGPRKDPERLTCSGRRCPNRVAVGHGNSGALLLAPFRDHPCCRTNGLRLHIGLSTFRWRRQRSCCRCQSCPPCASSIASPCRADTPGTLFVSPQTFLWVRFNLPSPSSLPLSLSRLSARAFVGSSRHRHCDVSRDILGSSGNAYTHRGVQHSWSCCLSGSNGGRRVDLLVVLGLCLPSLHSPQVT